MKPAQAYPSGLTVDLDVFSGPFDLLVTLVLREEIDLWEVSVSRLIGDYVLGLADAGEFDLETTSQFLVHVATLLEMKSRLLLALPGWDDEEELEAEEAGEELLAALVRYTQFRRAAEALSERWAGHAHRLARRVPLPTIYECRQKGRRLPASVLARAMEPLLREPRLPDTGHITDVAVTLVQELRRLRDLLSQNGGFTFHSVAPRGRLERAVTFFALLELHNRGEARLQQKRAFEDIVVTPLRPEAAAAG